MKKKVIIGFCICIVFCSIAVFNYEIPIKVLEGMWKDKVALFFLAVTMFLCVS